MQWLISVSSFLKAEFFMSSPELPWLLPTRHGVAIASRTNNIVFILRNFQVHVDMTVLL